MNRAAMTKPVIATVLKVVLVVLKFNGMGCCKAPLQFGAESERDGLLYFRFPPQSLANLFRAGGR